MIEHLAKFLGLLLVLIAGLTIPGIIAWAVLRAWMRSSKWRVVRRIGLWIDAKAIELRQRADRRARDRFYRRLSRHSPK